MKKLTREGLHAIYEKQSSEILMREVDNKVAYIIVGMGEQGLNSGAKTILDTLSTEVNRLGLRGKVMILQSDYPEMKESFPIVEVILSGSEPVLYGKVTEEFAKEIINAHILTKKSLEKNVIDFQSQKNGG